jgi:hypothetical protein
MQSKILALSTAFVILSAVDTRAVRWTSPARPQARNSKLLEPTVLQRWQIVPISADPWDCASTVNGSPLYAANSNYSGDHDTCAYKPLNAIRCVQHQPASS